MKSGDEGCVSHKSGPLIIFYPFIAYNNARFQWVALCFLSYIFVPMTMLTKEKRGLLESVISAVNRKYTADKKNMSSNAIVRLNSARYHHAKQL
jgi:hypothetical protein